MSLHAQPTEHGNIKSSYDYVVQTALAGDSVPTAGFRVLDIGCRHGSLIKNLETRGIEDVYGLDINEQALAVGRQAYPSLASRLLHYEGGEIPFPADSFDLITLFDVLEHIPDPAQFLAEVARVLKPHGYFVGQTPNKPINICWEVMSSKSLTRWRSYHCSLQTVGSLRRLLTDSGFADITIEKSNTNTTHNRNKIRRRLGPVGGRLGLVALVAAQRFPVHLSPNLFFHASMVR